METSSTLKFESNVPVEVALKYRGGREVTSARTDEKQMMYTLTSGMRMYLDLDVAARVDELGLKPGEGFVICKVGKGVSAQWAVQRKEGVRSQETGVRMPMPKPVEPPEQVLSRKLVAAGANDLASALKAAVSAACEAQAYAKSIGFVVTFSPADIAQMACIAARLQGGTR